MVEVSPSWVTMMMKMTKTAVFALLLVALCFCLAYSEDEVYTNNFLVELHHGGQEEAHRIAKRHNFEYRGTVSLLIDLRKYYQEISIQICNAICDPAPLNEAL